MMAQGQFTCSLRHDVNSLLIYSAVMNMCIEAFYFPSTRNAAGTFLLRCPGAPPVTFCMLPEGSAGLHTVRAPLDFLDKDEGPFSAPSAVFKAEDVGSIWKVPNEGGTYLQKPTRTHLPRLLELL